MAALTIGQLAQEAGVHVETVRYYERRRLLPAPPRTSAGYRQYAASDLWRLQFIGRAKQLGFTLAEIADLLGPGDGPATDTDNAAVLALADAKLRALDEKQDEIATTRARLQRLVAVCADPESDDCTALRVP